MIAMSTVPSDICFAICASSPSRLSEKYCSFTPLGLGFCQLLELVEHGGVALFAAPPGWDEETRSVTVLLRRWSNQCCRTR